MKKIHSDQNQTDFHLVLKPADSGDQNLLKDAKSPEMKKIHSDQNQTDFHLVLKLADSGDQNLLKNAKIPEMKETYSDQNWADFHLVLKLADSGDQNLLKDAKSPEMKKIHSDQNQTDFHLVLKLADSGDQNLLKNAKIAEMKKTCSDQSWADFRPVLKPADSGDQNLLKEAKSTDMNNFHSDHNQTVFHPVPKLADSGDLNLLTNAKSPEMMKIHSDQNQTDFHPVRLEETHPLQNATSPDTNLAKKNSTATGKNKKDWKNHPARKRMLEIMDNKATSKLPEPDPAQKLITKQKVHTDAEDSAASAEMTNPKLDKETKSANLKFSFSTRAARGSISKANAKHFSPMISVGESKDSPNNNISINSIKVIKSNILSFNGDQAVSSRKREHSEFSRDCEMPIKKQKQFAVAKDDQYWSEEEMKRRMPLSYYYPTHKDDDYPHQFHPRQIGYM